MTALEINEPTALGELIDGEVIVMNFDTGIYYSMTGTGAVIWQMVVARLPFDEIVARLADRFQGDGDTIRTSTEKFLAALQRENLIRPTEHAASDAEVTAAPNGDRMAFEVPVYSKYTDLEDLLLVDPIHEVDTDAGWPTAKS